MIDASKCISYLTIELKTETPDEFIGKTENWIFGCDICQDVCPWNRFGSPHLEPRFSPISDWEGWNAEKWENLTEIEFKNAFGKSPLTRAGFEKIKSSLAFSKK